MTLNAIDDEGVEFQLLAPFFEALLPAFQDGANEIRIEPAGSELKITYHDDSSLNFRQIFFGETLIARKMEALER